MKQLEALSAHQFANRLHEETHGSPLESGPPERQAYLLEFAEWMIERLRHYGLDLVPRLPIKH